MPAILTNLAIVLKDSHFQECSVKNTVRAPRHLVRIVTRSVPFPRKNLWKKAVPEVRSERTNWAVLAPSHVHRLLNGAQPGIGVSVLLDWQKSTTVTSMTLSGYDRRKRGSAPLSRNGYCRSFLQSGHS